jgi:signal transduction histidine kinase
MRLGAKSMLLLLVAYASVIIAFAVGVDRWLHGFEDGAARETSRLLARENAAILSERTLGALEAPDEKSRALLRARIEDVVLLSEVVRSITVVDGEGRVVASDRLPAGQLFETPAALFASGWMVQPRRHDAEGFLRGGNYGVDVPIVENNHLVGYVEIEIRSRGLEGLFVKARRHLTIAAVVGLAGALLLGGAIQFQISRSAKAITRTLEDAIRVPPGDRSGPGPSDEFARALKAAGRVRKALSEARLETSRLQESFSALAQVMRMGVLLLPGDGEPEFANPRALELLGSPGLDELRGRWPAIREGLAPALSVLASQSGSPASVEVALPGAAVPKLRVEPYRLGGADHDWRLVLLNDPEILEALETDVRLASQLQGLARVYRTVAHEVRAPLSAMMIHLDLLRESIASQESGQGGNEAQQRYVSVLREELERLNRSLSEVLTQTVTGNDTRSSFDLREALTELGTLLAPQARRQGVELRTRMPDSPVVLVGYRDRLKQSLLNVAVNALEAMPGGGRMSLELDVDGSHALTRVTDTGRGVPADYLARIYDRDFTTKGSGSGIGLYVARTLVEMHGGEISVESEEGRGTSVEVRLPIVPRS